MRYVSPLRYPGGKAKLLPFVRAVLHENALAGGAYIEPYAGGASVALGLLLGGDVSKVYINDIDPLVHAFWFSVLNHSDDICRLIRDTPVTAAEWKRQKSVQMHPHDQDPIRLGFAAFFLNRTNHSGMISSGGMIGGRSQKGAWKLNARYNKRALIERIEAIARQRSQITLSNDDALLFLSRTRKRLPRRSLVYLDPPYFVKGRRRLYANFYEQADHERIASFVQSSQANWMVSYDDVPQVRALYRGLRGVELELAYTARDRYRGSEVIFMSESLVVPNVGDSAALSFTRNETLSSARRSTKT